MKRSKPPSIAMLSIAFALLSAPAAMADTSTSPQHVAPSLVALGDSITFGYNLGNNRAPSTEAFPYLIGKAKGYRVTDLGIPGWTSGNLLKALQTANFDSTVRSAKVITLDIGSNDILQPAVKDGLLSTSTPFSGTLTSAEKMQFVSAIAQFGQNFHAILSKIHELNPNARLVLYNVYDPIPASLTKLHATSELLVEAENALIAGEATQNDLPVANAYQAFNQNLSTYVKPGHVHPTVAGQQELAKLGLSILGRPQPKPYYENKVNFVYDFLALLGQKSDPIGRSPFKDVPTRSYLWGYVHKALDMHLVAPVSKNTFGSYSDVTRSEAAQIAVNYLHVKLTQGETALTYANRHGLFLGLDNRPYMTLRDEVFFVERVAALESVPSSSLPSSWKMTEAEASILRSALQNSTSAPYMQANAAVVMKMTGDLTTAGAQDQAAQSVIQSMQNLLHMNILAVKGFVDAKPALYSVVTMIPTPTTSSTSTPAITTVKEYLGNGKFYMDVGGGWQVVPGMQNVQTLLSNQMGGASLTVDALQNMTATPIAGGYQFTGSLNTQKVEQLVKILVSSMPISGASASTTSSTAAFIASVVNHMQTTITFTILKDGAGYELRAEQMHALLTIPLSGLPQMGSQMTASDTALLKDIKGINIDEHVTSAFMYDRQMISKPSHLPQ